MGCAVFVNVEQDRYCSQLSNNFGPAQAEDQDLRLAKGFFLMLIFHLIFG